MGASPGRQFLLLLWKNWLLQKRRKLLTVCEIGLPIVMSVILLAFRQIVDSTEYPDNRIWDAFSVEEFDPGFSPPRPNCTGIFCRANEPWTVAYSPDTAAATDIVAYAAAKLNLSYVGESEGLYTPTLHCACCVDHCTCINVSMWPKQLGSGRFFRFNFPPKSPKHFLFSNSRGSCIKGNLNYSDKKLANKHFQILMVPLHKILTTLFAFNSRIRKRKRHGVSTTGGQQRRHGVRPGWSGVH